VELQETWTLEMEYVAGLWLDVTNIGAEIVEKAAFHTVEAFVSLGIAEILAFVQRKQIDLHRAKQTSVGHPIVVHNSTTLFENHQMRWMNF
jgi:hypothetical protein